ncbi:hypothetical protein POTOM_001065 [Populus tomentosa]|uniref:Uncharacterized protein n=1 Tax=Populus tomentosa TaxID=118781 RepID=A0A8X8DH94_POPTO|nr:hypothetical protein POTOM_001065 [Populus tomentosa]
MDVSDDEMEKEIETPENGKKGFIYLAFRLTLALLFPIFAFLSLSILLGFLAIFMGHLSITTPLSLPSQCKILSSSVDLRSSKVCEPGFLNYKAKHVFYPYNRSKFRCRYDYYWASVFEVILSLMRGGSGKERENVLLEYLKYQNLKFVVGLIDVQRLVFVWNVMIIGGLVHFAEVPVEGYANSVLLRSIFYFQIYDPKGDQEVQNLDTSSPIEVEYKDYSLGQTQFALAEAPNEALPLNCRPNFGAAWLTKDKFKVNKTYDCWYTSGILKVSLYRDDLFSCQAKDPSQVEMIKRFFILSKEMLHSLMVQKKGKAGYWRCIAGVIAGFSTSIIAISFIIILQHIKSWFRLPSVARMFSHTNIVFFKRTCFLVAYISFMGWLTIQYGKRLGLPEIRRVYNY